MEYILLALAPLWIWAIIKARRAGRLVASSLTPTGKDVSLLSKIESGEPDMGGYERDVDTLARTIWGEARGEGLLGMEAVADVIINRYNIAIVHKNFWHWPASITQMCLMEWQFTCWNDGNKEKMLEVTPADIVFKAALAIAYDAVDGLLKPLDITDGATHYLNPDEVDIKPNWAHGKPLVVIKNHAFYRPKGVPDPRKLVD